MAPLPIAQVVPEVTLAPWLSPLLLLITLLCVTAWYVVINRQLRGLDAVPYEDRQPVPWGADGAALAVMAVVLAAITFFATDVASDPPEIDSPHSDPLAIQLEDTPKIDLSVAGQYAVTSALLVVLMIGWQRMQVCANWTDFGLPTSVKQIGKDAGLGLMTFAAALLPVYAVQFLLVSLLGAPTSHQVLEDLMNDPSGTMLMVAALMAVVVAPLFEEFSFRIMLQGWLEKIADEQTISDIETTTIENQQKKAWPILVSSLAFAIAHTGQGYAPVALFVLACFLGYIYRQTHRLAPCVVAHMAFNALSLAMAFGTAPGMTTD